MRPNWGAAIPFLMAAIVGGCGALGYWIGSMAGSIVLGAFGGALLGVPLATIVVHQTYWKAFREASKDADYSHLTPKVDDD